MTNWTQATTINTQWVAITSSDTGLISYAVIANGRVYKSTDYGVSWNLIIDNNNNINIDLNWSDITCSSDGSKVFGCVYGGYVYISTNSGSNWNPEHVPSDWTGIASSTDGLKLCACAYNDKVHISNDGGYTWTQLDGNKHYTNITTSSDGYYINATEDQGHIITFVGRVATFYNSNIQGNWSSITSNSDNTIIIVSALIPNTNTLATDGYLYISTDYGTTFSQLTSGIINTPLDWSCITTSNNGIGQHIVGTVNNGLIYISVDYGANWISVEQTKNWSSATISSNGNIISASVNTGDIYNTQNGTSCYCSGTNILILKNNEECYEKIENLKIGDLVKIYGGEYKKLVNIGKGSTYDYTKIKVIKKDKMELNKPSEDLYITAGHSLFFENVEKYKNEKYNNTHYIGINKYFMNLEKILSIDCNLCENISFKNNIDYYQIILENNDINGFYCIYANNMLSETMSYKVFSCYQKDLH